jgi:uncharacterized protein (DUF2147 family)
MSKSFSVAALIIGSLLSVSASAQSFQNLDGLWRIEDGSATLRVAKCPTNMNRCATVVSEVSQPGEPSQINKILVRDMRPNGKHGWIGQYVVDGQSMKANAKLLRPDKLTFKVCAFAFLCETIRLDRVGK